MIEKGTYRWEEGNFYHEVEVLWPLDGNEYRVQTVDTHNKDRIGDFDSIHEYILENDYKRVENNQFKKQKRKLNI